jgi:ribonuclease P protein component
MRHEAYIPTQQTETEKNLRIPSPYEDGRGPQGNQPPPESRTQKASSLKFPKEYRLRTRREFLRLQKSGQRIVGKLICVDYRLTDSDKPKLGITASSRYGDAPERSRFKRLAREAFRTSVATLPPNIEINVVPRQRAKGASSTQVRTELLSLLNLNAPASRL